MPRIRYQEALGLEVRRGRPPRGRKPSKNELQRIYIKESKSIREVARELGCTKDMIYRCLKEYNIETREPVKKTNLWEYDLESLKKAIIDKGTRGFARELGVRESTLRYHVTKARRR